MNRTAATPSHSQRWDRYRNAEDALWSRYELTPRERFIEMDSPGQRVRIQEIGTGDPLLLVHGSGGSGAYWAPLVAELSREYRCVVLDRPGWTQSTPIDYSQDTFRSIAAKLLDGVLSALDIDRASIIGGSIGDLYALHLALGRPTRVDKVVLMGGGPLSAEITPPTFIRLLRSPLGRIMVRVPQRERMVRQQLRGLGHGATLDAERFPSEFIDLYRATGRNTDSMRHERDLVKSVLTGKGWVPGVTLTRTDLAAVGAPTLMIFGSDDPTGSLDIWRRFTDALPNATLHVAPESGHLPWYDDPAKVGDVIRTFLQTR